MNILKEKPRFQLIQCDLWYTLTREAMANLRVGEEEGATRVAATETLIKSRVNLCRSRNRRAVNVYQPGTFEVGLPVTYLNTRSPSTLYQE
jgi:hypothetical protein